MVVVERSLADRADKCHREASRRADTSFDQISKGFSTHGSRMECIKHRITILEVSFNRERTTGDDDNDNRLSTASDSLDEFALGTLKVQIGQRVGLSREDGFFSDKYHSGISP